MLLTFHQDLLSNSYYESLERFFPPLSSMPRKSSPCSPCITSSITICLSHTSRRSRISWKRCEESIQIDPKSLVHELCKDNHIAATRDYPISMLLARNRHITNAFSDGWRIGRLHAIWQYRNRSSPFRNGNNRIQRHIRNDQK